MNLEKIMIKTAKPLIFLLTVITLVSLACSVDLFGTPTPAPQQPATDESVSNLVSGEISVWKARSHHRPQATHGPARPVADHFSRYPEGIRKKIVEDRGTSPRPPHSAKSRPLRRQNHSRELLECAPCSGV